MAEETKWRIKSEALVSTGSITENLNGLAGLAKARKEHKGQFFTPKAVVTVLWTIINRALPKRDKTRKWSILDTSVGNGRLLEEANPKEHELLGCDIDARCIEALREDATHAGFEFEFKAQSLEETRAENIDLTLINPPFSITLDHQRLQILPSNTAGTHGLLQRAKSHRYAIEQALECSTLTLAIAPESEWTFWKTQSNTLSRNIWGLALKNNDFQAEGAEVSTRILIFGPVGRGNNSYEITSSTEIPTGAIRLGRAKRKKPSLKRSEDNFECIKTPQTGDTNVKITRHGKRIKLSFKCGLIQAKVMNHLLGDRLSDYPDININEHGQQIRQSKEFRFVREGQLHIEAHLMQPDPLKSFQKLISEIEKSGGTTIVCRMINR